MAPRNAPSKPAVLVFKAAIMEFVLMVLFVFIGCGSAVVLTEVWPMLLKRNSAIDKAVDINASDVAQADYHSFLTFNAILPIALAFGLSITALVYMSAHISGGQINCAVTMALALVGTITPVEAVANTVAQFLGSILGAVLVLGLVPFGEESALGSNSIAVGIDVGQTFLGELMMTLVLVLTVLECAVNKNSTAGNNAPLAIGLAVVLGHLVLVPLDGCSINPSRSFGPALLSGQWKDFWVFLLGPYCGALLAVALHLFFASTAWDLQERNGAVPITSDELYAAESSSTVGINPREKIRIAAPLRSF